MEQTAKPRLRIGRVILLLTMAFLLMCVGYVGGNALEKYLKKKMSEKKDSDIESKEDKDDSWAEELLQNEEEVEQVEEQAMGFMLPEVAKEVEKKEAKVTPLKIPKRPKK